MGTISGILVYGLVFILIVVGLVNMFFGGILGFLWTLLEYGLKIAAVVLVGCLIYGLFSKKG